MARKSRVNSNLIPGPMFTVKWKIALYLRLSVEDGDDIEMNSIGNQRKICLAFLENTEDTEVVKVFTDHGYSGMNYKRPGFVDLYNAIVCGEVNCVVVKDISRFGREYIATSEFLQITFPSMGIRFISVNDDYDSLNPDANVEGLLLPFKMIMNDAYAKDASRKIRSSITAKMNSGEFLPASGSIPYGYNRNPEMNTFDVDDETAPIVQRIFEMRANGSSFNHISRVLNEEGIPSPGRIRYLRGISKDKRFSEAGWIRGTIRKITNDPAYLGCRVHGKVKRDRLGADKTWRDKSEWKVIEGAHPAIISEALFELVQAVNEAELAKRKTFQEHDKPLEDYRDTLRGKLYCGDCGARMIALKRVQRITSDLPSVVVYQCNGYHYSNSLKCENHYTTQTAIIDKLKNVIDHQIEMATNFEAELRAVRTVPRFNTASETSFVRSISIRRKNLEGKLEKALMDLADGLLTKGEYDYIKGRYVLEHTALVQEEEKAKRLEANKREIQIKANKWFAALKKYRSVQVIDKELVDLLVERILIFSDKRILFVLNYSNPVKDFATLLAHDGEVAENVG